MFPFFATGFFDTGGNLPPVPLIPAENLKPVLLTTVANLPLVSTTPKVPVAIFVDDVADTDGASWLLQ